MSNLLIRKICNLCSINAISNAPKRRISQMNLINYLILFHHVLHGTIPMMVRNVSLNKSESNINRPGCWSDILRLHHRSLLKLLERSILRVHGKYHSTLTMICLSTVEPQGNSRANFKRSSFESDEANVLASDLARMEASEDTVWKRNAGVVEGGLNYRMIFGIELELDKVPLCSVDVRGCEC